jgi:hypothetical protein
MTKSKLFLFIEREQIFLKLKEEEERRRKE